MQVVPGTYSGVGNIGLTISVHKLLLIASGKAEETIVDAENGTRVLSITRDSVIDSLTLTRGRAGDGAGLSSTNSKVKLSGCILKGNRADSHGGGLSIQGGQSDATGLLIDRECGR